MTIDARFLVDVHFRQGYKEKSSGQAEAAADEDKQNSKVHHRVNHSEEWHQEQELLGSDEHAPPPKRGIITLP